MEQSHRQKMIEYLYQFFAISAAGFEVCESDKAAAILDIQAKATAFMKSSESSRLSDSEFYAVVDGFLAKLNLLAWQAKN